MASFSASATAAAGVYRPDRQHHQTSYLSHDSISSPPSHALAERQMRRAAASPPLRRIDPRHSHLKGLRGPEGCTGSPGQTRFHSEKHAEAKDAASSFARPVSSTGFSSHRHDPISKQATRTEPKAPLSWPKCQGTRSTRRPTSAARFDKLRDLRRRNSAPVTPTSEGSWRANSREGTLLSWRRTNKRSHGKCGCWQIARSERFASLALSAAPRYCFPRLRHVSTATARATRLDSICDRVSPR